MVHVQILGLILTLAIGLLSIAWLVRLPPRHAPRGVSWLPIPLLFYNLWVAGFLTFDYLRLHVFSAAAWSAVPPLVEASVLALLMLSLAWLYAHIAQVDEFLATAVTGRARRMAKIILAGLTAVAVAAWALSSWAGGGMLFRRVVSLVAQIVFPTALVVSTYLLVRARRIQDAAWRAMLSRLAAAYCVLFACLFALSIGWRRLAAVSHDLPIAVDVALELLYNVVTVVWVASLAARLRASSAGGRPAVEAPGGPDRTGLFAQYGITRREQEIVELICLGKTNQEIADQLFISLTTVKDHNYAIFQKVGARNRTELATRFLGARPAEPK